MTSERSWVAVLLVLTMCAGIGVCVWAIFSRQTTPTEGLLLSILLTVFSVLGSWLASAYYAEHSFSKNLRIFALKASEKVTNLSNELDRLIGFLQQELNAEDYESTNEALLARDMRIQAAIHVINTLKSVNDRSLSDWEGVIGEEIIAQREEQELREEQLRELLERVSTLPQSEHESLYDPERLRREVEAVRKDIRVLGAQIGGVPVRQPRPSGKEKVEQFCPACGTVAIYRQRAKANSVKTVQCANCHRRLFSLFQDGAFVLKEREVKDERAACPTCSADLAILLSAMPGASVQAYCNACGGGITAIRRVDRIEIRAAASSPEDGALTPDFLEQVRAAMPSQPWPVGAAQRVAQDLQVPYPQVRRAVQALMTMGVFKMQIDGQLYERANSHSGDEN